MPTKPSKRFKSGSELLHVFISCKAFVYCVLHKYIMLIQHLCNNNNNNVHAAVWIILQYG